MAAPSKETLEQLAASTGHQPGTLEKVLRLLDLLQETSGDSRRQKHCDQDRLQFVGIVDGIG